MYFSFNQSSHNRSKAIDDDIGGNDTNGADWFFDKRLSLCCDVAIFPLLWHLLRVFRLSLISHCTLFVSIKIRPIIYIYYIIYCDKVVLNLYLRINNKEGIMRVTWSLSIVTLPHWSESSIYCSWWK